MNHAVLFVLVALVHHAHAHAREFSCSVERGAESITISGSYARRGGEYVLRGRPRVDVRDAGGRPISGRRGPRVDFAAWRVSSGTAGEVFHITLDTQHHGFSDLLTLQHRLDTEDRDVIDLSLARGDGSEVYARNYRDVRCEF